MIQCVESLQLNFTNNIAIQIVIGSLPGPIKAQYPIEWPSIEIANEHFISGKYLILLWMRCSFHQLYDMSQTIMQFAKYSSVSLMHQLAAHLKILFIPTGVSVHCALCINEIRQNNVQDTRQLHFFFVLFFVEILFQILTVRSHSSRTEKDRNKQLMHVFYCSFCFQINNNKDTSIDVCVCVWVRLNCKLSIDKQMHTIDKWAIQTEQNWPK